MTTGSGSSFPITRLAAKYNDMRKNGQLLSNRRLVELIDDRIVQLAGRIDVDEAPDRVAKLCALWQEYTSTPSETEKIKLRVSLDAAFEKIYHDYNAWSQLFEAFDLRRKMAESEVKVLKEIKGIISYEEAYQFAANLLGIAMRIIGSDPKKLKELQYEFARSVGEVSDNAQPGFIEADGGSGEQGGGQ